MLRPRISAAIVGDDKNNERSMLIFSVLKASRGSAIMASIFITTAMVDTNAPVERSWAGGQRYMDLVIYTAALIFIADFGALGMFVKTATKVS